ncbi:MAG TPA: hypothetical protein G4N98_01070 [Thermoflexia bacterium]|nr:hypothetical protein [Thermoflexia bacterium]
MEIYRHTQFNYWMSALLLGTSGVLAVLAFVEGLLLYVGVLLLLLVTLFLFYALTVQVEADSLEFWFGTGLIRKQLPLKEIVHAQIVRNPWYYGWGIHLTPHGWLYNIAGLQAIELELHSGKKVRLGTDEPEQLLAALKAS